MDCRDLVTVETASREQATDAGSNSVGLVDNDWY
jgi:hypothetical protein